jgi:hypothetical protein
MKNLPRIPLFTCLLFFGFLRQVRSQNTVGELKNSKKFTAEEFLQNVEKGKLKNVRLYLEAGMHPDVERKFPAGKTHRWDHQITKNWISLFPTTIQRLLQRGN